MRILFTRHGESEANVRQIISNRTLPHQLTAVGVSQARALAHTLRNSDVTSVIASPIVRAQATGRIIAEKLDVPLSISPALREFDCGRMEGRGDKEAWMAHQAVTRAWDEDQAYTCRILPDGESFNDLQARFVPFVRQIMADIGHQHAVLLVSHGGLLHHMLPLVLANVDRAFTQHHPLGNCELVVTRKKDSALVCTEWAGLKMMEEPHNP